MVKSSSTALAEPRSRIDSQTCFHWEGYISLAVLRAIGELRNSLPVFNIVNQIIYSLSGFARLTFQYGYFY